MRFRGKYSFLSNFHDCQITYLGRKWKNTETAYQAAKFHGVDDAMVDLLTVATPVEAKRVGYGKGGSDWHERSLQVMLDLLRLKFANEVLREKLLATGDEELCETVAWHDIFWGVCECGNCPPGLNILGKLLAQVRDECKPYSVRHNELHPISTSQIPLVMSCGHHRVNRASDGTCRECQSKEAK